MNAHCKGGFGGQYHAAGHVGQGSCVRGRERSDYAVRLGAHADVFRILAAELQRLSAVRLDFHMDARSERVCRRSGACRYRRIVVLEVASSRRPHFHMGCRLFLMALGGALCAAGALCESVFLTVAGASLVPVGGGLANICVGLACTGLTLRRAGIAVVWSYSWYQNIS